MASPRPPIVGARQVWRRWLSCLLITSLLLQPITVIAATVRPTVASSELITASAVPAAAPAAPALKSDTPDQQNVHPAPRVRSLAQVNPTPSGARPAYPLNHLLDGRIEYMGTPPANHNFEAPNDPVGAPPYNYDFSVAPSGITQPTNNGFEIYDPQTGVFPGWTSALAFSSGSVTQLTNSATGNHYVELYYKGTKLTSDPIALNGSAPLITFVVAAPALGSHVLKTYVLHGENYATKTQLGSGLNCNGTCNWGTVQLSLPTNVGSSIKIHFEVTGASRIWLDDITLTGTQGLFPGYTTQGSVERIVEGDNNAYARLNGGGAKITTLPFTLGAAAQIVSMKVMGLSTGQGQYKVRVLPGPDFDTPVNVIALGLADVDVWQEVAFNVSNWQGNTIKLELEANYNTIGIDDVGVPNVQVSNWQLTATPPKVPKAKLIADANGNHYVETTNTLLTSAPFTVSPYIQQITLRHRSGSSGTGHFNVKLHRIALNQVVALTSNVVSQPGDWQTLTLGINIHVGENVKLEIEAIGAMQFDDVGVGERMLLGWQIGPPHEYHGIAIGEDERGSYVTSADGSVFSIRSELIATGIIDESNRGDKRHYSIGYAIGQSNPSSIHVTWVNSQGQSFDTDLQDAAGSPTGYREHYFYVADSWGPEGYFVISVTGGGKVYSIADNIARQHLAEPFSYKVGIKVDTSTGAFGYEARDLEIDGLMPLLFTRYYNGHSDRLGPLGYGWSHSYETRLVITNDADAGVVFGSGKEVFFNWTIGGQGFTPADTRIHDQLLKNADGSYTYISQNLPPEPYSTSDQCSLIGLRRLQLRPQRQEYHFNSAGQLTNVVDHNFLNTALLYNPAGQLTSINGPGGATLSLFYAAAGQVDHVQSSLGATAIYGYAGVGSLVSVNRSDRGIETYEYFSSHYLYRITDANGQDLVTNTIDAYQRVNAQKDAHHNQWSILYDTPAVGVTAVQNPDEQGTHYFYHDQYQRTTDWVAPTGEITSYLYDGVGNLQKVIDGSFGHWNFSYDNNANLLGITDPQGNPLVISYNPEQLPSRVTDGNGNMTDFTYDAHGNVTKILTGLEETNFTYTSLGQLESMTTPWRSDHYTYHPDSGKVWTHSDGLGHTWTYTYEPIITQIITQTVIVGRKEIVTDPKGQTTTYLYNLANRLVAIRDHNGNQKLYLYDAVGHLLMAEDELGRRTYWDYNAVGLVESKTDPEGKITTYTYDANRTMASMTDPNNLTTVYEHDFSNRLKKEILPGNRVTEYWYDGCGRVEQEMNPRQQSTFYDYNVAGRLITMTMPLGSVFSFTYDGNGNLKKATDPLHSTTEYTYDALNRPDTVTDGEGYLTDYTYDKDNRRILITNALGETTTYHYDAAARMTQMIDPLQRSTFFGYDALGNRTVITDTIGRTERFDYDALNRSEFYTNKAGRRTQFVYDAASQLREIREQTPSTTRTTLFDYYDRGLLKTVTNALNEPPTTYLYDNGGRLTNIWEPDGKGAKYFYHTTTGLLERVLDRVDKPTLYEYDAAGNTTAVIDPMGRRTTFDYDELNRLHLAAAPNSPPTRYEYYPTGRLKELWTPSQRPTFYTYDGRGLLKSETDAFQRAMRYDYDAVGRLKKVTDRQQSDPYVLEYFYDAGGRLTDMHGATVFANIGVHYGYDNADRINAVIDPNGRQTTYSYNNLDQLLTETRPADAQGPRSFSYTYDEFDRLWTATDARQQQVVYQYDLLGRVKKVIHPGGEDNFAYDNVGRLDWYSDITGVTDYVYNDASRVSDLVTPQGTVAYSYNDAGQRQSMTLPPGPGGARTITYGYDPRAQLQTITDWQGRTNTLGYDDDRNLTSITRYNGVNTSYGYDNAGRLDNLSHTGPAGVLAAFDYTLDDMGNRTDVATPQGSKSYDNDPLNRLTATTDEYFQYHPNGDFISANNDTYFYNSAGQLERVNADLMVESYTITYDANGNTATMTDDTNTVNSYQWDWANHLTSATVGGQTVTYGYDALGIRVSATVSSTAGITQTNYLWDRMAELPLLIDDGSQAYVHGAGPLAQIDATGARYDLLGDGLGSVRTLVDGSGAAVGGADYATFGAYRNQSGVTSRFGFTGEYYAQETGMWHLRARDLHPGLGRFLSPDPVQPNAPGTQGYNLYAYVANNPTNWVDPSGYTVEPVFNPDQAALSLIFAMGTGLVEILACGRDPQCRGAKEVMRELGSQGTNFVNWTAESLQQAFSTYPHVNRPVSPATLVLSLALSNTPVFGDLYDLYTGVSGYDPITGQYLAGWERLANIAGAIPLLGLSGANIRHGVHATEALIDSGDELAQFVGKSCSFDAETPVATSEGAVPIRAVDVGDRVLAWNETLGETGYYTVTAVWGHADPVTVQLVVRACFES